MTDRPPKGRIVITGVGAISPLGSGVLRQWDRLLNGASGLSAIPADWERSLTARVMAPVPDRLQDPEGGWMPSDAMSTKEFRRSDRYIALALSAAEEALSMADWRPQNDSEKADTGVVIASGVGGWTSIEKAVLLTHSGNHDRMSPFTVPAFLANAAAAQVSIRYGFTGPIGTPVTACAASLQAIGDAARLIASGEAKVVLAGGAEASLGLVTQASFAAARSLSSRFNARPEEASRPFDADRDGFVPAEGAACVVLEDASHASQRGAMILAELAGYGTTADAHHMTSPWGDGRGAVCAMQRALVQAGSPTPDLVLAHATSTPLGDLAEARAINQVLNGIPVPVVATKSATGHLLGAAGALGVVWGVCALTAQRIPPNRNLRAVDTALPSLKFVGPMGVEGRIDSLLINAFGFGGVNASAVLKRADQPNE
jgi:3-oxoacyl-[acyl-carrier-protein] synthase II